jgi:ABC-type nitrate/sulfonate/bicarbonate transport system permease component
MQTPRLSDRVPVLPAATVVGIFAVWELATRAAGTVQAVPPPSIVLGAIIRDAPFLAWHAAFTLAEAAAGLVMAVLLALLVSASFARSPLGREAFMPVVLIAQTIPILAIAPLLAQAIGEGLFANVIVTAFLCWFPAVIAFSHGFLQMDEGRLAYFKVHGASPRQIWWGLQLPGAAPSIVAGIRTSAGFAVISAIVAEYGTLVGGIGATIAKHVRGIETMQPDQVFSLVVVSALLGLAFTWSAHTLARLVTARWTY